MARRPAARRERAALLLGAAALAALAALAGGAGALHPQVENEFGWCDPKDTQAQYDEAVLAGETPVLVGVMQAVDNCLNWTSLEPDALLTSELGDQDLALLVWEFYASVSLACRHANEAGAVPGHRLVPTLFNTNPEALGNDSTTSESAAQAALEFILPDNPDRIPDGSGTVAVAFQTLEAFNEATSTLNLANTPVVGTSPSPARDTQFESLLSATASVEFVALANAGIAGRSNWTSMAVLHSTSSLATTTAARFTSHFADIGGTVLSQSFVESLSLNVSQQLRVIKSSRSLVILLSCEFISARLVLEQAAELGMTGPEYVWLGTQDWVVGFDAALDLVADLNVQGGLGTAYYTATPNVSRAYAEMWEAEHAADPNSTFHVPTPLTTPATYDHVRAFAEAYGVALASRAACENATLAVPDGSALGLVTPEDCTGHEGWASELELDCCLLRAWGPSGQGQSSVQGLLTVSRMRRTPRANGTFQEYPRASRYSGSHVNQVDLINIAMGNVTRPSTPPLLRAGGSSDFFGGVPGLVYEGPGDDDFPVWPSGKRGWDEAPPDRPPEVLVIDTSNPGERAGMYTVAALGMVYSLWLLAINLIAQAHNEPTIRLSSPTINSFTIGGGLLALIGAMLASHTSGNSDVGRHATLCSANDVINACAFLIGFGSIFAKAYRVHRVMNSTVLAQSMRKYQDRYLLRYVAAFTLLGVVIEAVVLSVAPYSAEVTVVSRDESSAGVTVLHATLGCGRDPSPLLVSLGVLYVFGMMSFGMWLAYQTRNIKVRALNDSNAIRYAIMLVTVMVVAGVALVTSADSPTTQAQIASYAASVCVIAAFTRLFFKRFYTYAMSGKLRVKFATPSATRGSNATGSTSGDSGGAAAAGAAKRRRGAGAAADAEGLSRRGSQRNSRGQADLLSVLGVTQEEMAAAQATEPVEEDGDGHAGGRSESSLGLSDDDEDDNGGRGGGGASAAATTASSAPGKSEAEAAASRLADELAEERGVNRMLLAKLRLHMPSGEIEHSVALKKESIRGARRGGKPPASASASASAARAAAAPARAPARAPAASARDAVLSPPDISLDVGGNDDSAVERTPTGDRSRVSEV